MRTKVIRSQTINPVSSTSLYSEDQRVCDNPLSRIEENFFCLTFLYRGLDFFSLTEYFLTSQKDWFGLPINTTRIKLSVKLVLMLCKSNSVHEILVFFF